MDEAQVRMAELHAGYRNAIGAYLEETIAADNPAGAGPFFDNIERIVDLVEEVIDGAIGATGEPRLHLGILPALCEVCHANHEMHLDPEHQMEGVDYGPV